MKPSHHSLLAIAVVVLSVPFAGAQLLKPIDQTKRADVNDKSVNPGEVPFNTLSQPTHGLTNSALSTGGLKFQDVDTKSVDLKSVEYSTVSTPVLPQANFTAKRIADKPSDASDKQLDYAKRKAPINDRQIRAFTPAGEEELKKQLNEPH